MSCNGLGGRRAPALVRRVALGTLVVGLVFMNLACGANPFTADPGPDRDLQDGYGVYWGASIGPQLTGTQAPLDPAAITAFADQVRRAPSIINVGWQFGYCHRANCTPDDFPSAYLQTIRDAGAIPLVSWGTTAVGGSPRNPNFSLASIAAGHWDGLLRRYAAEVKAWGHPFFLRLDWEMNTHSWPWDPGNDGSTPALYVAAWRHIHDLFGDANARNVTWVWCPNVGSTRQLPALYPGSSYVNWSCLDGYNFGGTVDVSFINWNAIFRSSYDLVTKRIAPHKPMMVAEFATTDRGGSKAAWITNALAVVPAEYPRVRALVYYDAADQGNDWELRTGSRALLAFRAGISRPVYVSNQYSQLAGMVIKPPSIRPRR